MPQVKMRNTYADENMILHKGKIYRVSDSFALQLTAVGSGDTEKAAAAEIVNVTRDKLSRIDSKPDPGETDLPDAEDDDDGDSD